MKPVKNRHIPAVIFLLLLHFGLMIGFMKANFVTIDEPVHILGGLEILQNGGHSMNPESGVFSQIWAALPIVNSIRLPPSGTMENMHSAPYPFARHIFFNEHVDRSKNADKKLVGTVPDYRDSSKEFFHSRMMMSLLSIACGLLIFMITKQFCGKKPALLTLALYVFYPLYISNAPLATADMASSLFFLSSVYFFQRFMRNASIGNFLLTASSLSLLFLAKMSAAVIVPVYLVMILIKIFTFSPIRIKLGRHIKYLRKRHQKLFFSLTVCIMLTGVLFLAIWTAYGFRYAFPGIGEDARQVRVFSHVMALRGVVPDTIKLLQLDKILPQPYIYGFLHMYFHSQARWSYLDGEVSRAGHSMFFPKVFLYKTPPPIIIAFVIALIASAFSMRSSFGRRKLGAFMPYMIFALIFIISALNTRLNIGYRHLMPAITLFFPLTAFGFRWIFNQAIERKKYFLNSIPIILALWGIGECMTSYPHSLAYFSSFFGGSPQAYKHIVDSSLDWGQDSKNIEPIMKKNNVPLDGSIPLYLAYFGSIPTKVCGLENARRLSFGEVELSTLLFEFEPGYYIISATFLRGYSANPNVKLYLKHPELLADLYEVFYSAYDAHNAGRRLPVLPQGKNMDKMLIEYQSFRFDILRKGLERMEPEFNINYSIYVYKLDAEQIKKILKDLVR